MRRCIFSPRSVKSICKIQDYIARDKPRAAIVFADEIIQTCRKLAIDPGMGRSKNNLREGIFVFPYGSYLIYYTVSEEAVNIYEVYHARRKPKRRIRR